MILFSKFGVLSGSNQFLQNFPLTGHGVVAPVLYAPKTHACKPGYCRR